MAFTPFGKYLLDEELAKGGMARVYLARLVGLGGFEKRLVVKQVLPELAKDPRFVTMFVEEAKTLVRMSHPHIVPVYELGVIDGVYFLAMEYVEGATLAELLAGGVLSPAAVAHVGAQVADALAYAHQSFSLVHRDVTPRNVIVDVRGHARLLDFGIAAHTEGATNDQIFGSVGYMSPEQSRGDAVGPASDLFSLGTVMYEALSGEPAFLRKTSEETKAALLAGPTPQLRDKAADVPADVATLVDGLLAGDAAARPASAAEVAETLRRWLATNHVAGVAEALGQRVHAAVLARTKAPSMPPPKGTPANAPHTQQILATSAVLNAILATGTDTAPGTTPIVRTAPLARRKASAGLEASPAAAPNRARILVVTIIVAAVATATAAYFTRFDDATSGSTDNARAVAAQPKPAPKKEAPPLPAAVDAGTSATPPPDTRPATETGALTLNAVPWATVALDGRPLGNTPIRRTTVPVGPHTLTFDCPPLGRTAKVPLSISTNDQAKIVVDLTHEPPVVTVTGTKRR